MRCSQVFCDGAAHVGRGSASSTVKPSPSGSPGSTLQVAWPLNDAVPATRTRPEALLCHQFRIERHAGRAGELAARTRSDQPARRVHRHPCGHAAAGRASVDLTCTEQALSR
jgi:hypothetical protein